MHTFKIKKLDFIIFLGCVLPLFDWSEDLINFFDLFYLNIFKLFCLICFLLVINDLKFNKRNSFTFLGITFISLIFLFYHSTFNNLKGFFFVFILLIIGYLYPERQRLLISSSNIITILKSLIFFLFFFSIIEIIIDQKFITPDFTDNQRNLIGYEIRRVSFTFQDPNYFAFHVGGISIIINWLIKRICWKTTILALIIILFTGSRGALLAFIIAHFFYFFDFKMNRKFVFKILGILFSIALFAYFLNFDYDLGELYLQSDKDFKTVITRIILYTLGISIALSNPLFGIGHGRISNFSKSDYLDFQLPSDVIEIIDQMGFHNYPLEFIVENGLIIFLFFLMIFIKNFNRKAYLYSFVLVFALTSGYESPLLILTLLL